MVVSDAYNEHNESLCRDPVWWMAREECSESCLRVLWPFIGGLLNQSKFVADVGRERIRPLFRCISQLHERGELAEASAQHWKMQWYNAYGHALEQHQQLGVVSNTSNAKLEDLQDAMAALQAERNRLLAEVKSLHEVMRAGFFERLDREQESAVRMQTLERATQQHMGESINQHFHLVERLQIERDMVQKLQGEIKRLAMKLAAQEGAKNHLEEQLKTTQQQAFNLRLDAENRMQHSLLEQRRLVEEQAKEQERAVTLEREKRAHDPTRAEAMAALKAFACLWRCACTPYAGLNARRVEQIIREIMLVSTLLQPLSELVQEPLRRALGDRAAKELGDILAAESVSVCEVAPHSETAAHTPDSWCRWEDAPLPRRLPLHAHPPVLMSENR